MNEYWDNVEEREERRGEKNKKELYKVYFLFDFFI